MLSSMTSSVRIPDDIESSGLAAKNHKDTFDFVAERIIPGSARKHDRRDSSTRSARLLKSFPSAGRIRSPRERGAKSDCRIRFKFRRTTEPFGAASPRKTLEDFASYTDLSNHSDGTLGSCPNRLKKRSCLPVCGLDLGVADASRVGMTDARRIRHDHQEPTQWIRTANSF